MSHTLERRIGSIPFALNDRKTLDGGLPRNYAYYRALIYLTLDITIITAVTTAFNEGFWKIIKRLEVIRGGKDTIKSIDGAGLARMNHFLYGNLPHYTALPTAVAANQKHYAAFFLDFAMPRAINPIDTLLRARPDETLDCVVTWGAPSDIYSANPGNATINSGSVTIHSLEEVTGLINPLWVNKAYTIEKEVTATTPNFSIPLNGGNLYRGFLINADVDGNPNGSVISSIELKNGVRTFRKWDWAELQGYNKSVMDIEAIPTGWVFIDMAPDGMLTQSLDAKGMTDLELSFSVTKQAGTNKIRVYPIELALPSAA